MHLIAPLIAGVRGAENGTAEIYQRGTNTLQTYYSDFEGTTAVAGGIVTLDSNGAGVAYVDKLCRIVVKDSSGNTLRTFVAGDASEAVEVTNTAFTGTDYSGAPTAAGKPTTVDALWSLWLTNSGAIDWKVFYNGSAVTLQTLAGLVAAEMFNVKNPTYGAKGDGSTDDTTAINAAKTAAVAAGGGIVFFPPGTYRITSVLSLQDKLSFLGSGPGVSIISVDHATAQGINAASSTYERYIVGLSVRASQSNSGTVIAASASAKLRIAQCDIGNSNNTGRGVDASASSVRCVIEDCTIQPSTSGARPLVAGYDLYMNRCIVTPAAGVGTIGIVTIDHKGFIDRCYFNHAAINTAAVYFCINANETALQVYVRACEFTAPTLGTIYAIEQSFAGTVFTDCLLAEDDNVFGANVELRAGKAHAPNTTAGNRRYLGSRKSRVIILDNNTTPLNLDTYLPLYDTIIVRRSTNTDQVISSPVSVAQTHGVSEVAIIVHNKSGGNIAAETVMNGTAIGINNGIKRIFRFRFDSSEQNTDTYQTCLQDGTAVT